MFRQTTLKKFVLPLLLALLLQSNVLVSSAEREDFSRFILQISLKQTFPEAISMKQGLKSADWFIKKSKKGKPRTIEYSVNKTLIERSSELTSRLYPGGVKLAIDITKISVYSKSKSKYITRGKAEKGTTSFYQFLGFSVIERQLKFPVSLHLLEQDDSKKLHQLIRESISQIKKKIKIKLVLLDRGFISSKIVKVLYSSGCSFVIAYRKSKKFNKLFTALDSPRIQRKDNFYFPSFKNTVHRKQKNCWVIYDYSYGKPVVKVNLVVWRVKIRKSKKKTNPNAKHDYFLYISSPDVPPTSLYDLYGTRWRIETAFRQIKSLQAKTRVIHPTHRIWLFSVACLIYCSWVVRHLPKNPESVLPEFLKTEELEILYIQWIYSRIPVRKLVEQYQQILPQIETLFLERGD